MRLAAGAMAAAWLSVLITAICVPLHCGSAAIPAFLFAAGLVAVAVRAPKSELLRFDAGFRFVFFLFARLGSVLVYRALSPFYVIAILLLALSAAFFLR